MSDEKNRIEWALLFLRLSVFLVMFVWTVDKFIDPGHASKVYEHFYFLGGFGPTLIIMIGIAEAFLILAFVAGIAKKWTYGAVTVLHAVSTLSAWKMYTVTVNLLFFAAWPMLAACVALYLLRDLDNKFTLAQPD